MDDLIKRIVEARKSRGLTQSDISKKIGISRNSYTKIETGITELTIDHLIKISGALGVSVVSLIDPDAQSKDYFQELNTKIEFLEKQIHDKEELVSLQKQNSLKYNSIIIHAILLVEEKSILNFGKKIRDAQQAVLLTEFIESWGHFYLGLLQELGYLSGQEIEFYTQARKKRASEIYGEMLKKLPGTKD